MLSDGEYDSLWEAPGAFFGGGVSTGSARLSHFVFPDLRFCGSDFVNVGVHYTVDAALHGGLAEVDQQAYREMEDAQVGQDLAPVYRRQFLDRFYFYDQDVFNEEIDAYAVRETDSIDLERNRGLTLYPNPSMPELGCEQPFVHILE